MLDANRLTLMSGHSRDNRTAALIPSVLEIRESRNLTAVTDPIHVLLLGTFHFTSKLNMFTSEVDDMSAPHRQTELDGLVTRLATYGPSKVMIERPYDAQSDVNAAYAAYRTGARPLAPDEREQLGFRLAAACKHERVYPVDILHRWYEEAIEKIVVSDLGARTAWDKIQRTGSEATTELNRRIATESLSAVLHHLNTAESRCEALRTYTRDFARIVDGETTQAPTWWGTGLSATCGSTPTSCASWRLATNWSWLWAAHIPVLEQLFSSSGLFAVDNPLPYLEADMGAPEV